MEKIAALEDAISKKSLVGIYSVFYTIAHGDPNFSTNKFRNVLEYVKTKNIPGLLQEFDGEDFEPEEKWDEDYWALVASSLIDNFCEERIQHLEIVGKKVYPLKASEENKSPCKIPMEEGVRQSEKGKAAKRKKMMSGEQGKRIISEEKKKEVKANHANRNPKSGESLLSRILGSRSGR